MGFVANFIRFSAV